VNDLSEVILWAMAMNRNVFRVRNLHDRGPDPDYLEMSPMQRMELVWPLTIQAWALMGVDIAQSRLQRTVVRFIRREV
jgi:hypothetical protein